MRKLLVLLFVFFGLYGSAQVRFGVRAGINGAAMKEKYDDKWHNRFVIPRFSLGTVIEIPLEDNLSLIAGAYYNGKGCRFGRRFGSQKVDSFWIKLNYIEVPLKLSYHLNAEQENHFTLDGGVYLGYGFNGRHYAIGREENATTALHKKETEKYKRFDVGYNLSSSYYFNERYALQLEYSNSLLNMGRRENNPAKNRVLGLSFHYFFGKERNAD